ncbi:MAG: hypothetical protein CFE31_18935 [Rhizobiales bacterium PAR1]|nr:MAG: hypothetical protein CFE31_18935 [Rhizobiales bacterium PAR1]
MPVFKLGVTSGYPAKRIEALSNVGYASLWGAAENRASLEALEGAHNWFQIRFPKCEIHNHNNDLGETKIVFQDGHLQLTFLRPVLVNRFNEALTTVFAARCLRRFLSSEEGQVRLRKIGADPGAWFHTRYPAVPPHRGPKLSLANELFILNPAVEMPMIFRAIAEMARYIAATEEAGYVAGREYGR